MKIQENEIKNWHGLQKVEVIDNMIDKYVFEDLQEKKQIKKNCYEEFENNLNEAYFGEHSKIGLIDPELPTFFNRLRCNGIKIALNTGYNRTLQRDIIKHLNMTEYIDDFIASAAEKAGNSITESSVNHRGATSIITALNGGKELKDANY